VVLAVADFSFYVSLFLVLTVLCGSDTPSDDTFLSLTHTHTHTQVLTTLVGRRGEVGPAGCNGRTDGRSFNNNVHPYSIVSSTHTQPALHVILFPRGSRLAKICTFSP
jgi:hypothetical protein